jgi:4-amino-4-deoxy-L-arabinose transferase-like glycosyltransferase
VVQATDERPALAFGLSPWALGVALVAALTLARIAVLFLTPLELYPDEAQYWSWSRDLAFGYFSKPPLVAWLIRLTTTLGGDAEAWVRLSAPLCHAGAALALQRAGARLYGGWTGFWAAALYSLMPGVQLSAGVIATDAPLLLCLSLALWAYAALLDARSTKARRWAAVGLGAALGFALLAKYAALYFVLGLALHLAIDPRARAAWRADAAGLAAGAALLLIAPNLAWNAAHGFATVAHLLANTDLVPAPDASPEAASAFDLRQAPGFLASQLGVFGPIPFVVLAGGAVAAVRRGRIAPADRLLLALVAPPLVLVLVQAIAARANANWAAAAYVPASILVAAWLVRWRARLWLVAAVAVQGAAAIAFLVAAARPELADRAGLSNSLKRVRGWAATTEVILARARAEPGLSAVAVDDRFLFAAMTYYGREALAAPGTPPLRMWMRRPWANTEAESAAPLRPAEGRRVLAASLEDVYLDEMRGDFPRATPPRPAEIPLDPSRRRRVSTFVGETLHPAPRDPRSGLPSRPGSTARMR